jgi:hypothetical protein
MGASAPHPTSPGRTFFVPAIEPSRAPDGALPLAPHTVRGPMSKKQRLVEYSFRPALIVAMREAFQKACEAPQVADGAPGVTEGARGEFWNSRRPERLCAPAPCAAATLVRHGDRKQLLVLLSGAAFVGWLLARQDPDIRLRMPAELL